MSVDNSLRCPCHSCSKWEGIYCVVTEPGVLLNSQCLWGPQPQRTIQLEIICGSDMEKPWTRPAVECSRLLKRDSTKLFSTEIIAQNQVTPGYSTLSLSRSHSSVSLSVYLFWVVPEFELRALYLLGSSFITCEFFPSFSPFFPFLPSFFQTTWEAELRRISVWGQSQPNSLWDSLSPK
jgi:hypothetical protein